MRRPIVRRTDPRLEIIRKAIEGLIPGATPAFLDVKVTETFPMAATPSENAWTGAPASVAERVFTALYGRPRTEADPSPLAKSDAAKARRDVGSMVEVLTHADHQLTHAPWYPVRAGDLVHVHYESAGDMPAFGETYIVSNAGEPGETPPDLLSMVLLAHTLPDSTPEDDVKAMTGCFEAEAADDPLYTVWFEAGPQRLTIVRHGRVVHNGGAR